MKLRMNYGEWWWWEEGNLLYVYNNNAHVIN